MTDTNCLHVTLLQFPGQLSSSLPHSPTQSATPCCVSVRVFDLFPRFLGKTQSLSPGHFWHIRSHMYTWQFVTIVTNVHLGKNWQGACETGRWRAFYGWFIQTKDKEWASEIFIDFSTLKYFWKVQVWADAKLSFVNNCQLSRRHRRLFLRNVREYDPIFIYAQDLSSKNKRSC